MNTVAKLDKETIKVINKFLKANKFNPFTSVQLKAMLDSDPLGLKGLSAIHVMGDIEPIHELEDINGVKYDEKAHYAIVLFTCHQTSDVLLLDKKFNPLCIEESVNLDDDGF